MKVDTIIRAFDGKLVGNKYMKRVVSSTVALFPREIIDYIVRYCWFLSSTEDAWAFTFHGRDVADMHLIFLSDDLLNQPVGQIRYTVAHEIGHIMLGHKNSIERKQSRDEIKKQEIEADRFAGSFV